MHSLNKLGGAAGWVVGQVAAHTHPRRSLSHSPRHAGGCTVRPGGHVGRLPAVRVRRSARAGRHGGSPSRRRSRRGPAGDWARWGRGPAVWSRTGGRRSGGGENVFNLFLFFCSHFCYKLLCNHQDNPAHLSLCRVLNQDSHTCALPWGWGGLCVCD